MEQVRITDGVSGEITVTAAQWGLIERSIGISTNCTISSCAACHSAVLATRAVADHGSMLRSVVDGMTELLELCEESHSAHLYVVAEGKRCRHIGWRDPGRTEWAGAVSPGLLRRR